MVVVWDHKTWYLKSVFGPTADNSSVKCITASGLAQVIMLVFPLFLIYSSLCVYNFDQPGCQPIRFWRVVTERSLVPARCRHKALSSSSTTLARCQWAYPMQNTMATTNLFADLFRVPFLGWFDDIITRGGPKPKMDGLTKTSIGLVLTRRQWKPCFRKVPLWSAFSKICVFLSVNTPSPCKQEAEKRKYFCVSARNHCCVNGVSNEDEQWRCQMCFWL